jgi:muramoyltetrapeptide carboxypeptidase
MSEIRNALPKIFIYSIIGFNILITGCASKNHVNFDLVEPINFSNISFIEPASGTSDEQLKQIQYSFPIERKFPVPSPIPYNAAEDSDRFLELKQALYADKHFIWAIRGGYGSARLLDKLESLQKPKNPKILIGYSDITFLHLLFNKWGWKSIHGAMPIDLTREVNHDNFMWIAKILSKPEGKLVYHDIKPLNALAEKKLQVTGELIGGNLTLLTNSLGTSWQLDGKNKIIFIEDINSSGYVIDRDLTHLIQSGVLSQASAVLFGSFVKSDEHKQFALERFANNIPIPVFHTENFGHGLTNYPLPFGFNTRIVKEPNASTPPERTSNIESEDKSFKMEINYNLI